MEGNERSCHETAAGATASAKLALAVRPRARPRRRTGRRNIPRAHCCFVEVAPTHPELLQGGLPTPTSTMLAQAISPCRHLCPSRRHHILPPSIPLHSMMEILFLMGEGTPIHSASEDFLFLHGSERGASTTHIVLSVTFTIT